MDLSSAFASIQAHSGSSSDLGSLHSLLSEPRTKAMFQEQAAESLDNLSQLLPETHSLGMLHVLDACVTAMSPDHASHAALVESVVSFLKRACADQCSLAPGKVASLSQFLCQTAESSPAQASACVLSLRMACTLTLAPPEGLTPMHADFFQTCLLTRSYDAAARVLDGMPYWTATLGCTLSDVVRALCCGAQAHIALGSFSSAAEMLHACLSLSSSGPASVAAAKRWMLLGALGVEAARPRWAPQEGGAGGAAPSCAPSQGVPGSPLVDAADEGRGRDGGLRSRASDAGLPVPPAGPGLGALSSSHTPPTHAAPSQSLTPPTVLFSSFQAASLPRQGSLPPAAPSPHPEGPGTSRQSASRTHPPLAALLPATTPAGLLRAARSELAPYTKLCGLVAARAGSAQLAAAASAGAQAFAADGCAEMVAAVAEAAPRLAVQGLHGVYCAVPLASALEVAGWERDGEAEGVEEESNAADEVGAAVAGRGRQVSLEESLWRAAVAEERARLRGKEAQLPGACLGLSLRLGDRDGVLTMDSPAHQSRPSRADSRPSTHRPAAECIQRLCSEVLQQAKVLAAAASQLDREMAVDRSFLMQQELRTGGRRAAAIITPRPSTSDPLAAELAALAATSS